MTNGLPMKWPWDVGGEKVWLWNVMDGKTRYILACHLSKERDARAAIATMRKATQAADKPPKYFFSDKLRSYLPRSARSYRRRSTTNLRDSTPTSTTTCPSVCKAPTATGSRLCEDWTALRPGNATSTVGHSITTCSANTTVFGIRHRAIGRR